MAKLSSVVRHEYLTIIKQPSFWITMLAIPLLMGVILLISYAGNRASMDSIQEAAKDLTNVAIIDKSGLINKDVVSSSGLQLSDANTYESLREEVRAQEREALIVFPENLEKQHTYQVYMSSNDFTKTSAVTSLGGSLLSTSLYLPLGSAEIIALAQNGASSSVTTYRDGVETAGVNEYIAPGLFLALFFIVFMFSVSYMLTSVSEEKENRSMEMVLTYVKPRTLILGKLLGVSLVTITQIGFFILLAIAGYLVLQQASVGGMQLPAGIEPSRIPINFWPIFFGFGYLITGFLMFAGLMTATAAAAPSSKEANSFSAVFVLSGVMPLYFITTILTSPGSPIVQFLTYFPLTSPVIALIRNTVGNMGFVESWLALSAMTIFMAVSIWIAIKAFRLGALEFGSTIKLSKLFKK